MILQVLSHTIHVWYSYLHLVDFDGKLVGKYTSPKLELLAFTSQACLDWQQPLLRALDVAREVGQSVGLVSYVDSGLFGNSES